MTAIFDIAGPLVAYSLLRSHGFSAVSAVDLGVDPAASFTVVSSTKITFVTQAQTAGLHNVTVTTPTGTSTYVLGDLFTDVHAALPT